VAAVRHIGVADAAPQGVVRSHNRPQEEGRLGRIPVGIVHTQQEVPVHILRQEGTQPEGIQQEGIQQEGIQQEGTQQEGIQQEGIQQEGIQWGDMHHEEEIVRQGFEPSAEIQR